MPDTKITALTAIGANPIIPATFPIPMVDLTDTSMAASGTTKKVTVNQILGAGGTATLASATITGDLTVDTSTLKVDSANNRVGVNTATPRASFALDVLGNVALGNSTTTTSNRLKLDCSGTAGNVAVMSFAAAGTTKAFYGLSGGFLGDTSTDAIVATDAAGAAIRFYVSDTGTEAMRLNATGLGVGGSPSAKLSVVGGNIRLDNNQGLEWGGANNYIYGSEATDFIALVTNGVEALRINNSQNIGIGVTPTAIFGGSGVNGKGLQGDSWTISSFGGSNDTYFGSNLYTSAYGVWSNRVNAASGAYYITGGTHIFYRGAAQAPGTITPTESARIDASGNLILQPSSTPPSLFANGQLTMNATSDTNLRFSYRGSDGVTRVANITLA